MLENLDRLAPREKAGLAVALLFMFFVVLDRMVLGPALGRTEALELQINTATEMWKNSQRILDRQKEVTAQYETIRAVLETAASSDEVMNQMSTEIDEVAGRTGLKVKASAQREARTSGACAEYTIGIDDFEAETTALIKFLNDIQSSPGMLRVMKLNVATGKTKGSVKGSMLITKMVVPAQK